MCFGKGTECVAMSIKERVSRAIDESVLKITEIGNEVLKTPELGYCEEKTSQYARSIFDELGIEYTYPRALTGVKAKLCGKEHKFNICIIGELDSVKCAGHRFEGENSAAHACGHNAQLAAMLGSAIALKKSGVMEELCGDITFMAVPAEEFIELEYRQKLKEDGKIEYYGGKQQLIYEGAFDDVDMAMMIHAQGDEPKSKMYVKGHNLGFLAKTITFKGKAVHGSTPFDGVNALNAAALAILGVHSNRETFRDEEKIRIHPIITKGGDVVNSVPDEVCVDTYVRGATFEAIKKGNAAVERAVDGACRMIGADYEIKDIPGYLPLVESAELSKVFEDVSKSVLGEENVIYGEPITGSSDIGDLSCIIPTIQPSIGGFSGALHSKEFEIFDAEAAYVSAARILALTAAELLCDDAKKAENVKANFKPQMTKAEYLKYLKGEEV